MRTYLIVDELAEQQVLVGAQLTQTNVRVVGRVLAMAVEERITSLDEQQQHVLIGEPF